MGVPPQVPPEQASGLVQGLPSLQDAVLAGFWHVPPEQTSSVQGLPSTQSAAVKQQPAPLTGSCSHTLAVPRSTRAVVDHAVPPVSVPLLPRPLESAALPPTLSLAPHL